MMPGGENVVVVCDSGGARAEATRALLAARQIHDATWYAPCAADEVDRLACAGLVKCVVFADLNDFCAAVWDERIDFAAWSAAGVALEIVTPADGGTATAACAMASYWTDRSRVLRRARVRAGLLLSVIAIATAFALLAGP